MRNTVLDTRALKTWIVACGVLAAAAASGAPSPTVATVGPLAIQQSELDERATEMQRAYEQRRGQALSGPLRLSVRRQALETLIRARLYHLEATRRGITVTDAEAEAMFKKMPIFNPGGVFSPSAFANARMHEPQRFAQTLERIKSDLRAERLADELKRAGTPTDEQLRRAAQRALERADVSYIAIPREAFQSSYREPSEREVVEYFRRHAGGHTLAGEADVRAVEIAPRPGEDDDRAHLRSRADSALAAAQAGAPPEDAATRFRGSIRRYQLLDDNLPGTWRGAPALNDRLFRQRAEAVFPEPVPTERGWLVVWVDRAAPRRLATLREVAGAMRDSVRAEIRRQDDERAVAALYPSVRDSLARPGYRIRLATIESARLTVGSPSPEDLQRFYDLHRAEYTRYDAASASVVTTPLAQARGDLVERWKKSQRDLLVRDLASQIANTWSQGRRDKTLESKAAVRELGATAVGAPLGADPAAAAVSDTLRRRLYERRVEVVPYRDGLAVAHVYDLVERLVPSLEQVHDDLVDQLHARQDRDEVAQARAVFEQDPLRYQKDKVIHYSKLWCRQPQALDVPLSRAEVEKRYRSKLSDYAVPERYRVSHILVRPAGADSQAARAAEQRARELLRRIRSGEDFAEVARRESDDDITRDDGGDLGYRSAGELDAGLQAAAFGLKPGQVSDVVRAIDGFHLVEVTEHMPEQTEPLAWVYTTVAYDEALDKAARIARHMADSLAQVIRTPAQAREVAKKLGLDIKQYRHRPGSRDYSADQIHMVALLESMKPGEMYPGSESFKGLGAAVMWVDSIAPPRLMSWDEASGTVLPEFRRSRSAGRIRDKTAELDSLLRAGWSFDSLGALWGGPLRSESYTRGLGFGDYAGPEGVDSLVFGGADTPALAVGELSAWLDLPKAAVRLRVNDRREADPGEIERMAGQFRGIALEYHLQDVVKVMKERFPVRIVDRGMRDVPIPPLPPMPEL